VAYAAFLRLFLELRKKLQPPTGAVHTKVSWLAGGGFAFYRKVTVSVGLPIRCYRTVAVMTERPNYSYGIAGDLHPTSFEVRAYSLA